LCSKPYRPDTRLYSGLRLSRDLVVVVLITGALTGIGRATALAFACEGHQTKRIAAVRQGIGRLLKQFQQSGCRGSRRTSRWKDDRITIAYGRPDARRVPFVFSKSLISVRSFTSAVGSGGPGGCSFFSLFIPLMTTNNAVAMMRKFKVTVRN